jgi:ssDNA-specific exonuclease RecJ
MDINSVPQDNSTTYANMKKALYAQDKDGKLKTVSSSGWEVEELVTTQALEDIDNSIKEAYELVKSGKYSTLYYHMYASRMDLLVLSQSTGFFQWTIKRDFKPEIFGKIKEKRLSQYCDVLGVSLDDIKVLPKVDNE